MKEKIDLKDKENKLKQLEFWKPLFKLFFDEKGFKHVNLFLLFFIYFIIFIVGKIIDLKSYTMIYNLIFTILIVYILFLYLFHRRIETIKKEIQQIKLDEKAKKKKRKKKKRKRK